MWIPNIDSLETVGKVIGVVVTALSATKASLIFLRDRSLERRKIEVLKAVDGSINPLLRFREHRDLLQLGELTKMYAKQLESEVQRQLGALETIRTAEALRQRRRLQDPVGVRKWLSLYKPEGFDGWISQTLFYIFSLNGWAAVLFFVSVGRRYSDFFGITLIVIYAAFWFFLAIFMSRVSLRLRRVGNAKRRGELPLDVNRDLGWLQQLFLWFRQRSWQSIFESIVYYAILVKALSAATGIGTNVDSTEARILVSSVLFLVAEVLRADVLSRRAIAMRSV